MTKIGVNTAWNCFKTQRSGIEIPHDGKFESGLAFRMTGIADRVSISAAC